MTDFLYAFQNNDPVDRANPRYQEVLDEWNRCIQAVEASTTDEAARHYFTRIVSFYNRYYVELYLPELSPIPSSSSTIVSIHHTSDFKDTLNPIQRHPTDQDSSSDTLGREALPEGDRHNDYLSRLTDDLMSDPNPPPSLIEARRELHQDMIHFSENRSTIFGPTPNPMRAHEMPATRHLPTVQDEEEVEEEL